MSAGGLSLAVADESAQLETMGINEVIPKIGLPVVQSLCFAEGTLVSTKNGLVSIEQIAVGDSVLTYSEEKHINEWKIVLSLSKNQTRQLTRIIVKLDTILATPGHRFFTDSGWMQAINLNPKISIKLASGSLERIGSVLTFDTIANVYNFEVQENHNYYITRQGLLVHNGPCDETLGALQTKFEALAEKHLLPKFRELDPNLVAGYTGPFKTGVVGNPQKLTYGQPVDLSKFDIDFWIESDILFEKYGKGLKADVEFRKILSEIPGFEGLKANKEGFSIKFKPSGQ